MLLRGEEVQFQREEMQMQIMNSINLSTRVKNQKNRLTNRILHYGVASYE